jgi:hypothetical protein
VSDLIIFACLLCLTLLGGFSFVLDPKYEKGVWIVMAAVSHLLAAAAGAKFGLAVPSIVRHIAMQEPDAEDEKKPKNAVGFVLPNKDGSDGANEPGH